MYIEERFICLSIVLRFNQGDAPTLRFTLIKNRVDIQ